MKGADRKAAVSAYKERKQRAGIYRVRCAATGAAWLGAAPDLEKIGNRSRYMLGQGTHPCKGLQAAWAQHGADAFALDDLEVLPEDLGPLARQTRLKDGVAEWVARLGAMAI